MDSIIPHSINGGKVLALRAEYAIASVGPDIGGFSESGVRHTGDPRGRRRALEASPTGTSLPSSFVSRRPTTAALCTSAAPTDSMSHSPAPYGD